MDKRFLCLVKFVIGFVFVVGVSNTALGEDFYKGKTIRFVVGYSPGGGYDTYARAVARHIGKHIPGKPLTFVNNMPGAGSLILANIMYNKTSPDGLTVGIWDSGKVLSQALGDKKVRFDAHKVGWIGAPVKGSPSCAIMAFTGMRTLNDILKSKKRILVAATRAGSMTHDLPSILNKTLGTNFEVIVGYKGGGEP